MTENTSDTDDSTESDAVTIEIQREREVVTVKTDLDVPSKYRALPIFAQQGWIYASVVKRQPECTTYRIEDDATEASLRFTPHWERSDRLPPGHRHFERKASDTFKVGDFLVDFRFVRDKKPQLRVRIHPDITDPEPRVVVEPLSGDEEGASE